MSSKEMFVRFLNTQNQSSFASDDIEIEAVTPLSMEPGAINTRVGYKILKQDGLESGYIGRTIDFRRLEVKEVLGDEPITIPPTHWDTPPQLERVIEALNIMFVVEEGYGDTSFDVVDFYPPARLYPEDEDRHEYLIEARDESLRFIGDFIIKPEAN